MFFGSIPALVTPFSDGRVAEDTFREFVEWQISEGSDGLVPCGTTGEVATLNDEEHRAIIAITVQVANGRVPVIAGCGTNSTAASIERIRAAADLGADAALCVVPYYNKPSQAGLEAHFTAIADASPIPIVVYNVPSRTVADISVDTLAKISRHPKIVAVKDATGNLARVSDQRLQCGEDFCQLSGNDDMALGFNAMGGVGCISVSAAGQALSTPRSLVHRRLAGTDEICADAHPQRLPGGASTAAG
jgi:4-hydroxy-tetrahydrodipicolinate synthase